jgi:sugar-specific transcriptional regulator TrmB
MNQAILTLVREAQENVNKLAKKELEVAKLWNKVPSFNSDSNVNKLEKFQMLQGFPRIQNRMKDMIKSAQNKIKIICSEKDLSRFYYTDILELIGTTSIDAKFIISPTQKIPRFIQTIDSSKIRLIPNTENNNQCFIVKDSDEVLVFLRNVDRSLKNAFAFWTDTSSLTNSMNKLFDYSWQNSLPLDFERYLEKQYN